MCFSLCSTVFWSETRSPCLFRSAFDVCQDLFEQGAESVTMVQRSPSLVLSQDCVLTHGLGCAPGAVREQDRGHLHGGQPVQTRRCQHAERQRAAPG